MFKKLVEVGVKILEKLDKHLLPVAVYTNSNSSCTSCELDNENEQIRYATLSHDVKPFALNKKDRIFDGIISYSDIKKEFAKALDAPSPVSILLCGPSGCGKSEFLKQIRNHFKEESVFIEASNASKAGIFQILYDRRPKYVLLDEIDKLSGQDQQALFNLMETGRLTKTTKVQNYDTEVRTWVFATANNRDDILEPLVDGFERYFLSEYSDDEFKVIAVQRLEKEGIQDEELALYIANGVLRGLNRKSMRDY